MKAKVIVLAIVLIIVSSCASSRTTSCDAYGDTNIIHNTDNVGGMLRCWVSKETFNKNQK